MQRLVLLLFLVPFLNCRKAPVLPTGEVAEKAMVVSAREEASKIGVEIMQKGGSTNADFIIKRYAFLKNKLTKKYYILKFIKESKLQKILLNKFIQYDIQ